MRYDFNISNFSSFPSHISPQNLGGEFDDPALIIAARCGYDQLCSQLLRIPGIQVNIEDRVRILLICLFTCLLTRLLSSDKLH